MAKYAKQLAIANRIGMNATELMIATEMDTLYPIHDSTFELLCDLAHDAYIEDSRTDTSIAVYCQKAFEHIEDLHSISGAEIVDEIYNEEDYDYCY